MSNEDSQKFKKASDIAPDQKLGICFCSLCCVQGYVYFDGTNNQTTMTCQQTGHKPFWFWIKFGDMNIL